ncbi:E3 ubiquitin-protein ligase RNF216 isoform X1 [Nothobranchius furzeri]|uniref:Ring finger protein 216 n=2 Tax=Nothobranchius furzeri TaxID=105023 RepID=A0A1A7ZTL5_NOTFU
MPCSCFGSLFRYSFACRFAQKTDFRVHYGAVGVGECSFTMSNGNNEDDVILLASFNVHRSQGPRRSQRELITISDDSDEEPVALFPGSPVLVPDDADDDDVSILEPPAHARRSVIRQAALWSGILHNSGQVGGQSSAASVIPTGDPGSAPSTSRDARTSQPATHTQTTEQHSTSRHSLPKPAPSSSSSSPQNQSQPKHQTHSQLQEGVSARTNVELSAIPSTSTNAKATATSSKSLSQSQPSTSTLSQTPAGSSSHDSQTSASSSCARITATSSCSSAKTQEMASTSRGKPDDAQASTSSAHAQSHPGTSSSSVPVQPRANPVKDVLVLPQQPSIRAFALVTQNQLQKRFPNPPQAVSRGCAQGNLIQVEPRPLAQAPAPAQTAAQPAQPAHHPLVLTVAPAAVLIADAPERLGPPEAGHRIILGSRASVGPVPNPPLQPFNGAPPAGNLSFRLPRGSPPRPNSLALNPEQINPAPGLGAVPPAPEDIPQIEDARPGPSAPQERRDEPSLVRTLITGVLDLFPDIQEVYVAELIRKNNVKDLNVICNLLLENPDFPRRETASASAAASSILLESGETQTEVTEDLFDYSRLATTGPEVVMQAADLLMADFRMLSSQDIKWTLNALKGHYAITRKALCEALKKWQKSGDPSGKRRRSRTSSERCYIDFHFEHGLLKLDRRMYFLENDRRYCRMYNNLETSVQKELTFYQQKAKEWAEHEDFLLALQVNEDEYKKDGQLIECGCCYGEFAFEKMTQCSDGHLFCKECLVKYAQEAVFGSGKSELSCMEGGCPCSYPMCELEKVLPENILCKYNERQAEEAVAATCADELVRCPFCNFPALLDEGMSLFSCPNPRCRKESCRKCHVQWKLHVGKTCEQVLERDEIRMRVLFEERMTAARVRKCVKCSTGLVKSEGCNRMSCRCGSFMCYLCREPITGYNHFCQHARSPGAPCRHCRKCSLWTDPTQDDERIIQEIQREGEAELSKKCTDNSGKRVGPPPEANADTKRPRVGPPPENPPNPNPPVHPPPLPPQAVQAPLFVPPRPRYPQAPPQGRIYHQIILPPLAPAPYVLPPQLPPMNNNNNNQHPPFNPPRQNMDLPMHYGPPPHYYRRF